MHTQHCAQHWGMGKNSQQKGEIMDEDCIQSLFPGMGTIQGGLDMLFWVPHWMTNQQGQDKLLHRKKWHTGKIIKSFAG